MRKKGFDYEECYLTFYGEVFAIAENKKNAKVIGETLIQQFDENEQLKSELSRYKEVNRLDIWKSSYSSEDALITELQNKCDKKQEHIVRLENKIHRMRENIKRLEALYHYRGYIGSGDVKKEYYRREKLLKAENDQLKQAISDWKGSYDELYQDIEILEKENEQLKQSVNNLKDTIIKITIAYQRKYDRNIVDLVHEVHDEDITDLIKELSE